ncbi:MAG: ISAzo13 family transposase, partial [Gammaproteobacteria bacterium]|nr:ISAzo13 family transposase [Gammaproteobacteria bacterium]
KTTTGLRVRSSLVRKEYEKGVKISDDQMAQLRIKNHSIQPLRNYTLRPRQNGE